MKRFSRRSFLRYSAAAAILTSGSKLTLVLGASRVPPQNSGQDVLARCAERIQQNRYGYGTLSLRSADGKPIAGARVQLEQTRHEFLFGSNIFQFGRIEDSALQEQYNERFAALLNYATLGFYWPSYEPQRGQPLHEHAEKTVAWCSTRGIACKGHPLVWDFADPRWLPREFDEIRQLSHQRITDCIQRFAGKMDRWDVVNEPTHLGRFGTRLGEWAQSLGAVPYVRQHLETARAAGPKATLLVNDYRVDQPFYDILDQLRSGSKLLFDAVGIQSHMHRSVWSPEKVWQVCDKYAALGLPVHFTETTIVSGAFLGRDDKRPGRALGNDEIWGETSPELEARQAEQVGLFYTTLFAHPAVQAITWWDFSDFRAWKRAPAGFLRKDMSPKPAYETLHNLIKKQWWSKTTSQTDAQGQLLLRLCYGDYEAVVTLPNGVEQKKAFSWSKHSERNPVISL